MYAIEYEKKPRYMVFAGLVFQPLDTNLFATVQVRRRHRAPALRRLCAQGTVPKTPGHRGAHPRRERSGHQPARRFRRLRRGQDQRRGSHATSHRPTNCSTRRKRPSFMSSNSSAPTARSSSRPPWSRRPTKRIAGNYGIDQPGKPRATDHAPRRHRPGLESRRPPRQPARRRATACGKSPRPANRS